jgi:DNA-binding beta-propeller fold protein YncE
MRKLLLQFVLPLSALAVAGVAVFLVYRFKVSSAHKPTTGPEWTLPLRAMAADADRLVVQDMNFHGEGQQPDCVIRGADKVRELFELIDIDPPNSGFHCMCDGEYWIYVYKGAQHVGTLGYHHGRSLRWHRGEWKGDGLLTDAAQEALPGWFQKNGCAYLQQLRDREVARQKKHEEEEARFADCFPENVRGDVLRWSPGRTVAEKMGDGVAVTVSVCRALGTSDHTWTSTSNKERLALEAVGTVDGKDFLAGLEKLRDDRTGLRGAARVFFREGYHNKVPAEARTEWVVRLATAVFTDGLDDDKPSCLRFLTKERDPEIRSLLRDVFHGKVGKEIDLTKAFGQEPGLRAGAALSLVLMGDDTIKPEIERMLPQATAKADIAALEVCLALLGDPSYIKTEHFLLQSYSIGLGGLKAIERYKGTHGMEALVKGGIQHPWGHVSDEALATFERITGKKMTRGEIEDWWEIEHEGKRRPEPVLKLGGNTDQLRCVVFSPDGRLVASGSNDSTAKVWDARTGEKIHTLRAHGSTVIHVAFHPAGKRLATAAGDQTIRIWDVATGAEIRTLKGGDSWVAYSPDGKRLASAGEDGLIRIWDADSGEPVSTFGDRRHPVESLAYRPDGRRMAVACRGQNVQVWDLQTGKVERTLQGPAASVPSVAYSPDGKYLAVACLEDRCVTLWDADSGELHRTLRGHTDCVDDVSFSPDGKRIASTGWDKTVKIWDVASGKELVSFKGHPEWINAVAYSPDGKRLATASEDKTIRIWDLEKILPAGP